jgi:hypothetical protein
MEGAIERIAESPHIKLPTAAQRLRIAVAKRIDNVSRKSIED